MHHLNNEQHQYTYPRDQCAGDADKKLDSVSVLLKHMLCQDVLDIANLVMQDVDYLSPLFFLTTKARKLGFHVVYSKFEP